MPIFEIEDNGTVYEVDAPDMQTAMNAFNPQLAQQMFKQPPQAPAEPAPSPSLVDRIASGAQESQANQLGALDILGTAVTGGLAQLPAGYAGMLGGILPGEAGQAQRWKEATEAFFTKDKLYTKRGQEMAVRMSEALENMPNPQAWGPFKRWNEATIKALTGREVDIPETIALSEVSQGADDAIYNVSGGEPVIAAGLKAVLGVAPDILSGGQAGIVARQLPQAVRRGIAGRQLKKATAEIVEQAKSKGYTLTNDKIRESVGHAATMLAPERQFDEQTGLAIKAVQDADLASKQAVNALYKQARSQPVFASAQALDTQIKQTLVDLDSDGFVLREMPEVQKRIKRIMKPPQTEAVGGRPATKPSAILDSRGQPLRGAEPPAPVDLVTLKHLDGQMNMISRQLRGAKPKDFTPEQAALFRIRNDLRNWTERQFDNAAVSGDPETIRIWKEAWAASKERQRKFKADKVIRRMIQSDATPETVYRWLVGASAMGAKKEAAITLRRLKDILGPEHPSLHALRRVVIRDVVRPGLGEDPNFRALIRNIDRLVNDNPSLVRELNIPEKDLRSMAAMARAADKVHGKMQKWDRSYFGGLVASLWFGHEISKRARVVNLTHRLINQLTGAGKVSQRDLVESIIKAHTDMPMVPPRGKWWQDAMTAGILVDAAEATENE